MISGVAEPGALHPDAPAADTRGRAALAMLPPMTLRAFLACLPLGIAACAATAQPDDVLGALGRARQQCGATGVLQPNPRLADAARRLSQGVPLEGALQASGYRAQRSFQWSMRGYASPQAVAQALVPSQCRALGDPALREVGVQRSGNSYWIIAAVPFDPPAAAQADDVAGRVLALVNQARAQPRRCGSESFSAAKPLAINAQLNQAAAVHAQSMARFGYLEHQGRDGSSPADRASRAGYDWRSIGENVAMGQTTPERVVQDWLRSPEHCANIMEPRFTEMGVAFAVNPASEGGIYWAQSFGRR
jgi:uncharacterized protein YkwD